MEGLSLSGFFFLILCATQYSAESASEIKITGYKSDYENGEYIDKKTYSSAVADNKLILRWDVLQNFPKDVALRARIVRYESPDDRRGTTLDKFDISICNLNEPLRQYLPEYLLQLSESGDCIQTGKYQFDDAGQFKFWEVIPPQELNGAYSFNAITTIESPRAYIEKAEIASKYA